LSNRAYLALKLGRARDAERYARRSLRLAVGEAHAAIRLAAQTNLAFARIRQGRRAADGLEATIAEAARRGLGGVIGPCRYLAALDAAERGLVAPARRARADAGPDPGVHVECVRVDLELFL